MERRGTCGAPLWGSEVAELFNALADVVSEFFEASLADRSHGCNVGRKLDDIGTRVENADPTAETTASDITHKIERITAALPSTVWMSLASTSMLGSIALKLLGRHNTASFVGQWAPTFLGLYNKLTKVGGATALLSSRR